VSGWYHQVELRGLRIELEEIETCLEGVEGPLAQIAIQLSFATPASDFKLSP
jgi:hypothetical protein